MRSSLVTAGVVSVVVFSFIAYKVAVSSIFDTGDAVGSAFESTRRSDAGQSDADTPRYDAAVCSNSRSSLEHIAHGGLKRRYWLHVPRSACTAGAAGATVPLIAYLHCYGCPCNRNVGWEAEAESRGFVLIKPCGDVTAKPSWNAGPCCGDAVRTNRDDLGFIQAAVLATLSRQRRPNLAAEAVYLTGFSNGGFMTSLLARRSTLFAAVAPVAGYEYGPVDQPARKGGVRIQIHHGLLDGFVNPRGCCDSKKCCCGITSGRHCTSVGAFTAAWGRIHGCEGNRTIEAAVMNLLEEPSRSEAMSCLNLTGCSQQTTVCIHNFRGHDVMIKKKSSSATPSLATTIAHFFLDA